MFCGSATMRESELRIVLYAGVKVFTGALVAPEAYLGKLRNKIKQHMSDLNRD